MTQTPDRLLDTAFITLSTPTSVGLSFLGLELCVVLCGVLSLLHALGERRKGDGLPLYTWAASFTYGLVMEILSYNFIKSFAHGQFTVMFYHRQLPLYVVTLYPVLQYTSIMAARRLRVGPWAEAFAAGLFIVAMDMPFDILGPVQGWWSWSDTDPNIAYRWHSVPVTSYYWHLAFGGILALLTRLLGKWGGDVKRPALTLALVLPIPLLVIVLGVISFLPFHFLKARGVPDGAIVAGLFVLSAAVVAGAVRRRGKAAALPADPRLLLLPQAYYGYHVIAAISALTVGGAAFGGRMVVIAAVSLAALWAHRTVLGEPPAAAP
jgi:hypothetical protein